MPLGVGLFFKKSCFLFLKIAKTKKSRIDDLFSIPDFFLFNILIFNTQITFANELTCFSLNFWYNRKVFSMFLCLGSTPILPDIFISLLAFILSSLVQVMMQEFINNIYLILKEWMDMSYNYQVILLGTAGSLRWAGLYGSQQDNTNCPNIFLVFKYI